ncbi:MAG: glycosyltransferase family 4 protein [Chloroflexi bacterium]|nr:glycosyltransferase family 4 protein [Chloroflexota bacterium]
MRVLYLYDRAFIGGAARTFLDLFRFLDREQVQPALGCPGGAVAEAARGLGVPVVPLPLAQLGGRAPPPVRFLRWLRGGVAAGIAARRWGAEALQANVPRSVAYGLLAARLAGRPFIWHVGDIHRPGPYVRAAGALARRIVPVSRAIAAALPRRHAAKTEVIYTGVDTEAFDPARYDGQALRRELGLAPETPLVACVGWVAPWKRQHLVVEVARRLLDRVPGACYLIIGAASDPADQPYWEGLRGRAEALPPGTVRLLGPRADAAACLVASDLLLHPAAAEPLGLALLEAMALERPVVGFRSGGLPEVVADGETGLVVPEGDVGALAEATATLLSDPARRRRLGARGRERVRQQFDSRLTARRFEGLYAGLNRRLR